jgi:hypothetical protein
VEPVAGFVHRSDISLRHPAVAGRNNRACAAGEVLIPHPNFPIHSVCANLQ